MSYCNLLVIVRLFYLEVPILILPTFNFCLGFIFLLYIYNIEVQNASIYSFLPNPK